MQTCDQTNQTPEFPSSLIPNQLITYTWQLQNLSDSPTVYVTIGIYCLCFPAILINPDYSMMTPIKKTTCNDYVTLTITLKLPFVFPLRQPYASEIIIIQ